MRKKKKILWMDEILHHLRNPGMMIPLKLTMASAMLSKCCRILSTHSMYCNIVCFKFRPTLHISAAFAQPRALIVGTKPSASPSHVADAPLRRKEYISAPPKLRHFPVSVTDPISKQGGFTQYESMLRGKQ